MPVSDESLDNENEASVIFVCLCACLFGLNQNTAQANVK